MTNPNGENIRYHSLDFLRAAAMILGIFYHSAASFAESASSWFVKDISSSTLTDWFLSYSHTFRMPLFFIVAGFFCALLIERKGGIEAARNRLKRIFLPFIVFGILFVPIWMVLVFYSYKTVSPTTDFIADIINSAQSDGPPSLFNLPIGHLWFLYYLVIFSVFIIAFYPLIKSLINKISLPIVVLSLFAVTCLGLLMAPDFNLVISTNLYLELWSVLYYLGFYLFGAVLFSFPSFFLKFGKASVWLSLLLFGVVTPLFVYFLQWNTDFIEANFVLTCVVYGLMVFLQCVGLIGLSQRFVIAENKLVRYFSNASYWLYIMHMPLVVYLQITWFNLELNGLVKFFLMNVVVFASLLLIYHFMVRNTIVGKMLNGRKLNERNTVALINNPQESSLGLANGLKDKVKDMA